MEFNIGKRKNHLVAGGIAAGLILVAASIANPASAAVVDDSDQAPISLSQQVSYEAQLADFLEQSPEPQAPSPEAPVTEQNLYQESLADWWVDVPWDAVAGQWGCESVIETVSVSEPDADGLTTASRGGMLQCDAETAVDLSTVAEPKVKQDGTMNRATKYCDFPGGNDHCLSSSGGTMTASFQWQMAGNKTGQARLGKPGVGSSCGLGQQIALGPVGIGSQGSVWYASATVNVNSYWSSSFLISGAAYSTWCATI